ncbi:PREDICTED: prominin-1 [Condylura cristata]|uniref:prominin-1 n=1 Tax=Condylura cristata TaxID=143302 RepID=UPI000642EA22|nr:PREDICTED: prominin-1 [Condylura cristata]
MGLWQLNLGCLLLLGLAACTASQGPESLEFGLPASHYETETTREPLALRLLYGMARNFLHVVLPRPFPEDAIRKILQKKFDFLNNCKEIVIYEVGVIFCVALGLLFVILMPSVGFCFSVCRCFNKCGGEMHQRQKKNGPFLKKCFTVSLWAICICVSFGILCGFLANQRLRTQIKRSGNLVNSNFKDIRMLVNEIPEQIKYVTSQFNTTKTRVFTDLDNIKSLLGGGIQEQLRPRVTPVLDNIMAMAESEWLPSLDKHINSVNDILRTDLSGLVQKAKKSFDDIPEMVQQQTMDIISDVKSTLNSISSNIDKMSEQIPFQNKLSIFLDYINRTETYINHYLPLVEKYDMYRWLGGLIICEVLTIIVVFYCLGLLCGTLGYDPKATPATRGCVSNTGGLFLMVGVGLSFLVCWIIMAVVVFTFIVGGNVQKLVCEPYQNRKLFQLLDTPYLINEKWKYYLSGLVLNNPNITLTFEQVYSDCKNNRGIYSTLKLENMFNISEHLDIQKHTSSISKGFENLHINVNNIVLLDDAGRKSLRDFSSSGVDKIDYYSYLAETSKTPTQVDLSAFANDLDAKVRTLPPGNLKDSLKTHVQTLRNLHQDQVVPLQQTMDSAHRSVKELQGVTSGLEAKVNTILASLESAQDFITNRISSIIVEESKQYTERVIIGSFERYLHWVKNTVTEQIASCRPVANTLDSAVDVFLCSYVTDPVNLFWFGMGAASMLLIPALIVAVKLAKYYRCMDSEDVYEDFETAPVKIMKNSNTDLHRHHPNGTV